MGRTKRPEWQYVQQVKFLPKGKWTCKCNFCGRSWDGGPLRIRAHILGIAGHGVRGPCQREKDRAAFVDALVNDLEEAASQAQGGASMSTHAKGMTNVSGSSKSNVESSNKKRKVPQGGLASSFGLQARKQANQALHRFFYAEDVPTWKVRSPYFLQMVKAIGQASPSYVPLSYHALRTTELNEEVKCVKTEIMGVREKWKRYGCSIVCDGWSDTRRRPIINFLACSIHGSVFLKVVDTSGETKTLEFIFKHLKQVIREIGPANDEDEDEDENEEEEDDDDEDEDDTMIATHDDEDVSYGES
ncbi:hypothetical protein L7F22_000450 [Adiantum nelumboides]|nr:hypothetical protein [Adiantum nelumboides]